MKTILVIEDDAYCSLFLKKILESSGYEVVIAENGENALASLRQGKFIGVFLDISLPDIDGFELAKKTKEIYGNAFPIIALTGYSLERFKENSNEALFSEILIKPISIQDLIKTAQKYFNP